MSPSVGVYSVSIDLLKRLVFAAAIGAVTTSIGYGLSCRSAEMAHAGVQS